MNRSWDSRWLMYFLIVIAGVMLAITPRDSDQKAPVRNVAADSRKAVAPLTTEQKIDALYADMMEKRVKDAMATKNGMLPLAVPDSSFNVKWLPKKVDK